VAQRGGLRQGAGGLLEVQRRMGLPVSAKDPRHLPGEGHQTALPGAGVRSGGHPLRPHQGTHEGGRRVLVRQAQRTDTALPALPGPQKLQVQIGRVEAGCSILHPPRLQAGQPSLQGQEQPEQYVPHRLRYRQDRLCQPPQDLQQQRHQQLQGPRNLREQDLQRQSRRLLLRLHPLRSAHRRGQAARRRRHGQEVRGQGEVRKGQAHGPPVSVQPGVEVEKNRVPQLLVVDPLQLSSAQPQGAVEQPTAAGVCGAEGQEEFQKRQEELVRRGGAAGLAEGKAGDLRDQLRDLPAQPHPGTHLRHLRTLVLPPAPHQQVHALRHPQVRDHVRAGEVPQDQGQVQVGQAGGQTSTGQQTIREEEARGYQEEGAGEDGH